MNTFWPEAKGRLHIDPWREVSVVNDFSIEIIAKAEAMASISDTLFFINLGDYKENEFEIFEYIEIWYNKKKALRFEL